MQTKWEQFQPLSMEEVLICHKEAGGVDDEQARRDVNYLADRTWMVQTTVIDSIVQLGSEPTRFWVLPIHGIKFNCFIKKPSHVGRERR